MTCLFLMRSLLLGHFVKFVKFPGSKLSELGHKYPEVSVSTRGETRHHNEQCEGNLAGFWQHVARYLTVAISSRDRGRCRL